MFFSLETRALEMLQPPRYLNPVLPTRTPDWEPVLRSSFRSCNLNKEKFFLPVVMSPLQNLFSNTKFSYQFPKLM